MRFSAATLMLIPLTILGCSKSPKDEALAGMFDGCYITDNSELKKFCNCVVDGLDRSLDDEYFKHLNDLGHQKTKEFSKQALEISAQCKEKVNLR